MVKVKKINTLELDTRIIAVGTYTGDDSNDRQITTGFKCSYVIAQRVPYSGRFIYSTLTAAIDMGDGVPDKTDMALHATDGFIVDLTIMNMTGQTYYYWGISE